MNTTSFSADLLVAADALAEALIQDGPVAAFHRARQALEADAVASGMLNELIAAQAGARRRQMNGGLTPADVEQLRALQNQAQANQKIMAYVRAQQAAVAYLPAVNVEISRLLGVDFAALSNTATC
jgi:cell fate (sporulation/competence/biofilm development) regulator YlbF (YheA/YmcA/DUF963 family)